MYVWCKWSFWGFYYVVCVVVCFFDLVECLCMWFVCVYWCLLDCVVYWECYFILNVLLRMLFILVSVKFILDRDICWVRGFWCCSFVDNCFVSFMMIEDFMVRCWLLSVLGSLVVVISSVLILFSIWFIVWCIFWEKVGFVKLFVYVLLFVI